MQKAVVGVLLLLGALALTYIVIKLAANYEVVAAVREVVVLWWQWVVTSLGPFFKVYALRRTMTPVFRIINRALIFLIGYELTILVRHKIKILLQKAWGWLAWWRELNIVLRWAIVCGIVFVTGFMGWGLIILPLWIPFLAPILKRLYMFWMDWIFDPWLGPVRRWFRRTMRHYWVFQTLRKPHRTLVYWIFVVLKKVGRLGRKYYRAYRLGWNKLRTARVP